MTLTRATHCWLAILQGRAKADEGEEYEREGRKDDEGMEDGDEDENEDTHSRLGAAVDGVRHCGWACCFEELGWKRERDSRVETRAEMSSGMSSDM